MTSRVSTAPRAVDDTTDTPISAIASERRLDPQLPDIDGRHRALPAVPGRRRPGAGRMRTVVRWFMVVVMTGHGLIHLLGAAKGLGWAEVASLPEPIGRAMGLAWLVAAAAVVATAVLLAVRNRGWWVAGIVGVVVSQAVILTSWNDARAGTVANVVLLVALAYTLASHGPTSYRAEYQRRTTAALAECAPGTGAVVTEADLAHLPGLVAEYVRRSGAVGQPRIRSLNASIHGRIRSGENSPWMTYTGEQVNTFGPTPSRLFLMDATMFGLPVDVLHVFVGPAATMRVKLCSVVPMVNASGPNMDRAETVTLFNDLCILAPAALIDAPVVWLPIDDTRVRGIFTNGTQKVTADLTFDHGDLVDFVSDDRMSTSPDGSTFTPQRWSTPLRDYRTVGTQRIATYGEGRWHTTDPQSQFAYLEYNLDAITFNPRTSPTGRQDRRPLNQPGSEPGIGRTDLRPNSEARVGQDKPPVLARGRAPFLLSGALVVVAAIAAGFSFFSPSLLTGAPVATGCLRGTALVILAAGLPVLVAAMTRTAHNSARGLVVWLGTLAYLLYQAVMFCFATPVNKLFLFYIAYLGLAIWSIVVLLRATDLTGYIARLSPRLPARFIAGFALTLAVLNAYAWLASIIPAVLSTEPSTLVQDTGLLTNPVYVQDLAIWLPLLFTSALATWRRKPWGMLVTGAMLAMFVLESIGIAADQWFGSLAAPLSSAASMSMVPTFTVAAVISAVPLNLYCRNLDRAL